MEPEADVRAVREVLSGDARAFETIVRRWQKPLIALAFRYCRDRAVAEEMAQDAFLRIYRRLDRYDGSAAFSTWMFAVALNVYRSHVRRRGQPAVAIDEAGETEDPASILERVEIADRDETVRRAVVHLPERYRDAVLLYYFHEMDISQAARILGVPDGTLKARLHRGRALLRKRLGRLLAFRCAAAEA